MYILASYGIYCAGYISFCKIAYAKKVHLLSLLSTLLTVKFVLEVQKSMFMGVNYKVYKSLKV